MEDEMKPYKCRFLNVSWHVWWDFRAGEGVLLCFSHKLTVFWRHIMHKSYFYVFFFLLIFFLLSLAANGHFVHPYKNSTLYILQNISFCIPQGKKTDFEQLVGNQPITNTSFLGNYYSFKAFAAVCVLVHHIGLFLILSVNIVEN